MDLNTFNLYLFGGTGDLSNRKLIPAMFRQETLGNINNDSEIIGIGSRDISVDDYTSMVQESLTKHFPGFNENDEAWKRFSKRLSYIKIDINSKEDWKNINGKSQADIPKMHRSNLDVWRPTLPKMGISPEGG